MPNYYVNTQAQSSGEHEVHESGCSHPPAVENRKSLGYHSNCKSAVTEAKKHYTKVDGCYYCCSECHSR
jgi:hypothetical protein